ncbi:MAG: glycosyltransferase [Gammaproteobacteria bacterium]|nr:glycosyltransferase [Gammaproteobacteria bacterium]
MISVVVPAYNCSGFIVESVESCLAQQVDEALEVIVVDDASTDDTLAALAAFSDDERVIVLPQERNRGPAACRNLAIEAAKGDHIALLDADDLMLPGRLDAQLRMFREEGGGLAVCATWTIEELPSGRRKRINRFRPGRSRQEVVRRIFLGLISAITPTLFFRRADALAVGGFDEGLVHREDSDFILKLLERGEMRAVEQPLVVRRIREAGLSARIDEDAFVSSRQRFARNAAARYPFLDQHLPHYWARAHCILARKILGSDPARSRRLLWRSLRERPTFKAAAALAVACARGRASGGAAR